MQSKIQSVVFCLFLVVSFFLIFNQSILSAGKISKVSDAIIGANNGYLDTVVISDYDFDNNKSKADGRFVAFSTDEPFTATGPANGPFPNDQNNDFADVYIRDRKSNLLYRASTKSDGSQFLNCNAERPSMAIVQRQVTPTLTIRILRIAFECNISTQNLSNVYIKEFKIDYPTTNSLTPDSTLIASCSTPINEICVEGSPNQLQTLYSANSINPDISANGNFIVFQTNSDIPGQSDTNMGSADIYRLDLTSANFSLISLGSSGAAGNSEKPAISKDGRFVVFNSSSSFLNTGGRKQIFLLDANANPLVPELISKTPTGNPGNANSESCNTASGEYNGSIANVGDNGRFIPFVSKSTDLLTNQQPTSDCRIFLRDRNLQTTIYIGPSNNIPARFGRPDISNDERFITFSGESREIYLYDRSIGVIRTLWKRSITSPTSQAGSYPSISPDGRFISFASIDLTYDSGSGTHIYIHDLIRLTEKVSGDFNADGLTDLGVFRQSNNIWYVVESPAYSNSSFLSQQFGASGDLTVPGDYDGDGKTDYAVFTPSLGRWKILNSYNLTESTTNFGVSTDIPVAADYDGDNKTDLAYFRPSNGTWYIRKSSSGTETSTNFGTSGDKPVPSDYDNDGKADIAVYRPSNGTWYLLRSNNNSFYGAAWGASEDIPVPMDIDGDGRSELGVWRPSNGVWHFFNIVPNANPLTTIFAWGQPGDKPVPGDYDNDGKMDAAVFRPSDTYWYILKSTDSSFIAPSWGLSTDVPIPYGNLNP